MDEQVIKIAFQYGIGGVFALVLGRIMWRIGERMIASIDALGAKWEAASDKMADRFEAHTKADVEAMGKLTSAVARMDGKLDAVLDAQDRTPVAGVPNFVPEQTSQQYREMQREAHQLAQPLQLRSGQTPAAGSPTTYVQHKRGRSNGG